MSSPSYLKVKSYIKKKFFFFMFVTKCHLSDLQLSVNYSFFFWRLPLKCDFCEWHWAKPLNNVAAQREKPIRPALSKTLREQDRLMRMNGRLLTHKLVHSACIQFSSSVPPLSLSLSLTLSTVFYFGFFFWVSLNVSKLPGKYFLLVSRLGVCEYTTALAGHFNILQYILPKLILFKECQQHSAYK